ncbi:MAG: hypothetical protein L6R00_16475 [Phycisphaerae bacterium]|nr:hypothetical protein [Phycisphaerae bacterium]
MKHARFGLLGGLIVCLTSGLALAQDARPPAEEDRGDGDRPRAERRERRDRGEFERRGGPRGFGGGPMFRGMRERMERMRNASPEERRRMELDGWADMMVRTYDLDDAQRATVREEIQRISDEYRATLGPDAARLDQLRDEMGRYWFERMRREEAGEDVGSPRDDPRFDELRTQMRDIMEKHPFDWQANVDRIEKLLPAEQVEMGRQRREEWRQNMGRFNREGDDRFGRNREDGRDDSDRRRDRMRETRRRLAESEGANEGERPRRDADRRGRRGPGGGPPDVERPRPPEEANPPQAVTPSPPQHPWDIYTEGFIRTRRLTKDQAASALAIVQQLKVRAAAIERAQAEARAEAERMLDAAAKSKKLAELDAPINELFKELQTRLDALLTAEQRQAAGASAGKA